LAAGVPELASLIQKRRPLEVYISHPLITLIN
jgi:hypothetical protein